MQQDVSAAGDSHQVEEAKSVPAQGGTDRDDAFWLSHDERRRNQGMSVRQYCHVNALPLSTYRYRLAKHRRATGDATADAAPPKTGTAFIAIGEPPRGPNASDIDMPTPQWLIDEQKRRAANPPEFPPQDEGKASSQADKPAQAQAGAQLDDVDPEPFKDQRIHITGWMTMAGRTVHTFAVSAGGLHIFDLRDFDLAKAGYKWQPLGECSGMLRWRDKVRAITCDPPVMLSGSENKPVVIADGSRRSSRDP